eukprot:5429440-Prorocentrum_lima.AAC.1
MRHAATAFPKRLKVLELCGGLSTGYLALKLLLEGRLKGGAFWVLGHMPGTQRILGGRLSALSGWMRHA